MLFDLGDSTVKICLWLRSQGSRRWMDGPSVEHYTFANFTLQCAHDNGTVYAAPNGCRLKHWSNYLHMRGPSPTAQAVGGGKCFLPSWLASPINCTVDAPAPPEVSYCHYYRNLCLASCGETMGMTAEMQCVAPHWEGKKPQHQKTSHTSGNSSQVKQKSPITKSL